MNIECRPSISYHLSAAPKTYHSPKFLLQPKDPYFRRVPQAVFLEIIQQGKLQMNQTDIGCGRDLLRRAGQLSEGQGLIRPFNKPVYINSESMSDEIIADFKGLFNCGIRDKWVSDTNQVFRVVTAGPGLSVPKVCVSRALDQKLLSSDAHAPHPQPKDSLVYILVIQGKDASERSKLVTKATLDGAVRALLYEASNGYSVVFSGAIFRSNVNMMFSSAVELDFVKVKDISTLNKMALVNKDRHRTVGIIC